MTKKSNFFVGSGNVFADLGLKNPEERLAKANLAWEITCAMKARRLTQQQAAKRLGTSQAKISDVVRGRLTAFTIDRLIKMLVDLGHDVHITYKPKPRSRKHANLTAHPL